MRSGKKFLALAAVAVVTAGLGALGGCAAGPPPPARPPAGLMAAHALPDAPDGREVTVTLEDVPPGRRVEAVWLIDPHGTRYPATALETLEGERGRRPAGAGRSGLGIGVGVSGGSSTGVHPSLNLSFGVQGAGVARASRRVLAHVPIPDPAAYVREAGRWRIEVVVRELTGERRTLRFPTGGE